MMTIIVMLILVGVTINLSANGGLFDKARTASVDTEKQKILEELIQNADFNNEGEIKVDELIAKAKEKYGTENVEYNKKTGKLTITGNKGKYEYKVTETEIKLWEEAIGLTDLEKYILGPEGEGRALEEILNENGIFIEDPTNSSSTIHKNIKLAYYDEDENIYGIRYGRDVYEFKTIYIEKNENEYEETIEGSLKKVSSPEGNLGKYVEYKGKTWIVLYDDESKVELISADALGSVTLGDNTFDTGKELYNELIEKLTKACKIETEIETGIRNVGGPAEDPETSTYDLDKLKRQGFVLQTDKETEIASLIAGIKQDDKNYLEDYNQMKKLGILATDTPEAYWMASRFIDVERSHVYFRARYIMGSGELGNGLLCDISNYGSSDGNDSSRSVRPVISLSPGILDEKTEEGTRDNPIKLD